MDGANDTVGASHDRLPEDELLDLVNTLNPTNNRHYIVYFAANADHWATLLCLSDDHDSPTGSFIQLDYMRAKLPSYASVQSQLLKEEHALRMAFLAYQNFLQQNDFELICPSSLSYHALSGAEPTPFLNYARFAYAFTARVARGDDIPDILNPQFGSKSELLSD